MGEGTANMLELRYPDRRRIHNLKYFTWVEHEGKSLEELNAQWTDFPDFWNRIHQQADEIDRLIQAFNERTGVLQDL
jgi:cysteine synthase A